MRVGRYELRDAEIHNEQVIVISHQNVGGLQVQMKQIFSMQRTYCPDQLAKAARDPQ
jgi:hypothetical protein